MSFSEIRDDYAIWPGLFVTPLQSAVNMATDDCTYSATGVVKRFTPL